MADDRDRIKGAIARVEKVIKSLGVGGSTEKEELQYVLAELNSVLNSPAMQQDIPAKEQRRRYAAFAMQGYLASPAAPANAQGAEDSSAANIARLAFDMADAMLKQEHDHDEK